MILVKGDGQVVLSVGAKLGVDGMGNGAQKIAAGLHSAGLLGHVICVGTPPESPWPSTVVNIEPLLRLLPWTPARLRTSLMLTCRDAYFDRLASRFVDGGDTFFGWTNQALHSMRRAKALGMPCVIHAANLHIREAARSAAKVLAQAGSRNNPFGQWMVRRILAEYRLADLVRVESSLTRDTLIQGGVPGEKIALIPPPADLRRFQPRSEDKAGPFTIGYVGFLSILKGFQYLYKAFGELGLPDANLILHGGHIDRVTRGLMVQAAGIPGVLVAHGDVRATYAQAEVIVQPSLQDGYSYVVAEAMACGLPVIVTDRVGAKDLVEDGVNGFVVPAGDVPALEERLFFLYTQRQRCREMGEAARKTVEQFTVERHATELVAALSRIRG